MCIEIEYLRKKLGDMVTVSHITQSRRLNDYCIYEPKAGHSDVNILYIVRDDQMDDTFYSELIPHVPSNFLLLSDIGTIPKKLENKNVIVVPYASGGEFFKLVNNLRKIFKEYADWEKRLLEAVYRNASLQELLDIGYEVIGYPMSIVDGSHNTLAITRPFPADDPLLSLLYYGRNGTTKDIFSTSYPTFSDIEKYGTVEMLSSVNGKMMRGIYHRDRNGQSVFFGIHAQDEEHFSTETVRLCNILNDSIDRLINRRQSATGVDDYRLFLEKCVNNHYVSELPKNYVRRPEDKWQLMCVRFMGVQSTDPHVSEEIMPTLKSLLPTCQMISSGSDIVALFKCQADEGNRIGLLKSTLTPYNAIAAFSCVYNDLEDTTKAWMQITYMFDNYEKSEIGTVIRSGDFLPKYIMAIINKTLPEEVMYHSAFQKVKNYDKSAGTHYLETMLCYLENNCSASATTIALDIHRNTLLYRLQKIEEIIGYPINGDEYPYMQFSAMLIKTGKNHE